MHEVRKDAVKAGKDMNRLEFFCPERGQPQGSMNGYARGKHVVVTSANKKLKPFRQNVTAYAEIAIAEAQMPRPAFGKHVATRLYLYFTFARPKSAARTRKLPVVKPDLDKLVRGVCDALTGVIVHDDAQMVTIITEKRYGDCEGVRVIVEEE